MFAFEMLEAEDTNKFYAFVRKFPTAFEVAELGYFKIAQTFRNIHDELTHVKYVNQNAEITLFAEEF